jgi:hypothetical protein
MFPAPAVPTAAASAKNNTGIRVERLPQARTARRATRSRVPFCCTSANSSVTPVRVRNKPDGNPPTTTFKPTGRSQSEGGQTPMSQASTMASSPGFTRVVQLTTTTNTSDAIASPAGSSMGTFQSSPPLRGAAGYSPVVTSFRSSAAGTLPIALRGNSSTKMNTRGR